MTSQADTDITFELDTATGPRVDYGDHSPEAIAAALPEGWEPDYSSQIKLASGQFRAPLVRSTRTYTLRDEDGTEEEIEAVDDADANEQAREWVLEGDWDTSGGTVWVDVTVTDDDGDSETLTVAIDPPEPKCSDEDGHDWQSPHSVLGGSEDNPGVQGHGGGVIIREVCAHCGAYKTLDTWAQRSDTGEQGLRSTSYQDADDLSLEWVESLNEDEDGDED